MEQNFTHFLDVFTRELSDVTVQGRIKRFQNISVFEGLKREVEDMFFIEIC